MADDEFLCVRCARHMRTCCQTCEIYVSPGDRRRIAAHTGRDDFHEFRRPANEDYLDQDDDPAWRDHVFRADGARRVLRRQQTPGVEGNCVFLGERGCVLPLETRPLVCRLYPFDYNESGVLDDLSPGCPLELLRPGQGLIEALDMSLDDARRWRRQLYEEIREEEHGPSRTTSTADSQ